jgi:uncharacterized Zn finger protein
MSVTVSLTEPMVRELASSQSYQRGREYQRGGQVLHLTLRGNHLDAQVQGSDYEPYRVRVTFGAGGIADTSCTCPYDWGGVCKHVVATLLAYLHDDPAVEERPETEDLLAALDRNQLQALLLAVLERHPDLVEWLEAKAQALPPRPTHGPSGPGALLAPLARADPAALRRMARAAMRSVDRPRRYDEYDAFAGAIAGELAGVLQEIEPWIEAGDGRTALALLEGVTEECISGWESVHPYDDEGEGSSLFETLARLWTEALLSADLAPKERKSWAKRLSQWQSELEEDGVEAAFDAAAAAARDGWDKPALLRVLQGEITGRSVWTGEAPWYALELTAARLNVLERQGRFEEFLRLAEAEGQTERRLTMLAKLGRVQEAVELGLRSIPTPGVALALARELRDRSALDEAFRIAEHGMGLPLDTDRYDLQLQQAELARWLRDESRAAGQTERALQAGRVVLESQPSLKDYRVLEPLAGEGWPALREEILGALRARRSHYREPEIQIFLHEGRVDDAIAALGEYAHYSLVEQVAEAAKETHPEWVIQVSKQQAESIMDAGQASAYEHAAEWLAKARTAYLALGRNAEWSAYLEGELTKHARKYKLVPMLRRLQ